jgi:hypothetical protein
MRPLEPATNYPKTKKQIQEIAKKTGKPYKVIKDVLRKEEDAETWMNDKYVVFVERSEDGVGVWLSMRRVDREPMTDWRDKQQIKNQLIGPECEAVELFPAESRLVDTANQFHLWGYADPSFSFPLGFDYRAVGSEEAGGSKQRPIEKNMKNTF